MGVSIVISLIPRSRHALMLFLVGSAEAVSLTEPKLSIDDPFDVALFVFGQGGKPNVD